MEYKNAALNELTSYTEDYVELYREVYIASYNIIPSVDFDDFIRKKAMHSLDNEEKRVYYCIDDHKILGYLVYDNIVFMDKKIRRIDQIAVKAGNRKSGIGQQLMDFFMVECKHANIDEVQLTVTKSNQSAVSFYEKNSFEIFRYIMKKNL